MFRLRGHESMASELVAARIAAASQHPFRPGMKKSSYDLPGYADMLICNQRAGGIYIGKCQPKRRRLEADDARRRSWPVRPRRGGC
jgi:hypothetical protein